MLMQEAEARTARLRALVESRAFSALVTGVVLLNAIVLGLATYRSLGPDALFWLGVVDQACVALFVVELALKFAVYRLSFFRSAWNVFDLAVVLIALVPASGPFSVLRVLRVLRMLRVVSVITSMRRVVEALFRAIPGISAILGLLAVFFYVGAVLSTFLFGEAHPDIFGSLGRSLVTLFQLMLYDDWAATIREVEATHRGSTVFFVIFTMLSSFAVLNLIIAVMVDALRAAHASAAGDELAAIERSQERARRELDEVEGALLRLERKIDRLIETRGPAGASESGGAPSPKS